MGTRRIVVSTVLAALVLAAVSFVPAAPVAEAAGPSIYWGAYIDGQAYGVGDPPGDTRALDLFESHAKKKMSIFHWGQFWMNSDGSWASFPTSAFDTVRSRGTIPMLTWMSVRSGYGAAQADFQSGDVASGKYDSFIRSWATAAKSWGKPFFLRFDHEMNGTWYAYGEGKTSTGTIFNGNQSGDYVKMWRHVHDIFTSAGATNATWVWCPNIEANNSQYPALSTLYPGDAYVDWSCLDGYNRPTNWLSFNQVFTGSGGATWLRNSYQDVLNVAPNKPMLIAETASYEAGDGGAKKAAWIKDMLLTQLPANFSKIKAIVWFNWNESSSWTFRIETTQTAQDAFASAIGSANYAANSFGGITTSPIPPPGGTATVAATSATLAPVADTFIDSRSPTSASGGTSTSLFSSGSPDRKSFLKFDLGALAGKTLTSVKLRIHTTNNTSSNSADSHSIYLATSSWSESTVTYNAAPSVTTNLLGSVPANTAVNTWYDITLSTAAVQPKLGGLFALDVQSSGSDGLQFDSRETSNKPQLVLSYN